MVFSLPCVNADGIALAQFADGIALAQFAEGMQLAQLNQTINNVYIQSMFHYSEMLLFAI